MERSDFLSIAEAASTLGVSTRHARRLADSGAVERVARGLVARDSVDRYFQSKRSGRTRSWAEHTAWGAVTILTGQDPTWLGATQTSRLRAVLRDMEDVDELLTRMRERTRVRTFEAHRAALPRLREHIVSSDWGLLGISEAVNDSVDGYLAESDIESVVRDLGLRASAGGTVALRATGFDFDHVRGLVPTRTVAALDAATSTDPRIRGVGRRQLADLLESFR